MVLIGFVARTLPRAALLLAAFGLWLDSVPVAASPALPADQMAVNILSYQRIEESLYPSGNIEKDQFLQHIAALREDGYTVIPLDTAVEALTFQRTLPDRAVVITINGGHRSALDHAIPVLLRYDLPFTLFIDAEQIDSGNPQYMSWNDVERLARDRSVTLGLHPSPAAANDAATIRHRINQATALTRARLGQVPKYLAYPYGDYSTAYRAAVIQSGFTAAFNHDSGTAYAGHDLFSLPRFVLTENYSDLDRFHMVASSLPLPVTDITPDDPMIPASGNPPVFGFTLEDTLAAAHDNLSCYVSEHGAVDITKLGKNRFELRVPAPFAEARARLNCTMPGPNKGDDAPRWRWFGMLVTLDQSDQTQP